MSLIDAIKGAGQWIMDMGKKIGESIDELNARTNTTGWSDRTLDMNMTVQEAVEKEEKMFASWSQKHADFLYFDAWLMRLSKDEAGEITDALLNIPTGRNVTPLDYSEYIQYDHRAANPIDLESFFRIGDCVFQIPPSFIEVIEQSSTERIGSIRQNGSIQANQGFANREIVIHIFFNGLNQINGYKVPGPAYQSEHYVDGLRPLMAQFRSAPFLPVENLLLNQTFNIHAVALSSINVQTIDGFPDTLEATLSLIEFDPEPYTNIESSMFAHMIDWDLYRYNYQRFFRELERPGYFPKVTSLSKNYPKFDFYSLNTDAIIKSKTESIGNLYDKKNYVKFLSDKDNVHLTSIQFGLSNLIPSSQMEGYGAPMIQYLGNTDASVSLAFETTDLDCVSRVTDMMQQYRLNAHMLSRYNKVGFLLIDNELIQLTGSRHFVLNTLDTSTVPDFPGLYRITMSLTSYNVEPFDDSVGGELYGTRPFSHTGREADAIDNDLEGLHRKVLQDNYIEKIMAERLKLYPDLNLPTLKEVNQAISFITQFRKNKGLAKYPISTYPIDSYLQPGSASKVTYNGCVDPDYYVFYPVKYSAMTEQLKKVTVQTNTSKANSLKVPDVMVGEAYTIDARMAVIDQGTTDRYYGALPNGTGGFGGSMKDPTIPTGKLSREAYVQLAMSKIGCGYNLGSVGNYVGGKQYFDCTSLIAWCFWQFGEWGGTPLSNGTKPISYDYPTCKFMYPIPISEAKAGDLAWRPGHAGIITGKPLAKGVWETVEAMNPSAGVRLGQFNGYTNPYTHVFRPYAFAEAEGTKTRSVDVVNAVGAVVRTNTEKELSLDDVETGGSSKNVQIRTDMKFDSYVTGAVLNKHCQKGMANKGAMLYSLCQKHNVDPALVTAIAMHETGHGTSSAYVNKNNPGGIMDPKSGWSVVMKFATLDAGFDYMISNLAKNYINIGLNTISKIGQKYCPVGAHNDPNNLNVHWVPTVTKYYKEIKATAYDVATGAITLPDAGEYVPGVSMGGVESVEANPAIPAYGEIAIDMPYEWKQAQAGQTLHNKVVQYSIKNGKHTRTKKTKEADVSESKTLNPNSRAPLAIDDNGNSEVVLEGYNGYKNNIKPYLSADKEEYELYKMPAVKTGQSKVNYQNNNFGRPLVIKSPVLRALEKAGKEKDLVPPDYFKSRTFEGESYPYTNKKKQYSLTNLTDDAGDSFRWFERAMIEEMTGENMFSYMCVDMVQGNNRGRLCRAFPTYVFSIIDSNGEWLDGRKLWSNYYFYRSVLDIKVFQESEQPIHTAQITVSNTFDRLGKAPTLSKELYNKTKIENDLDYGDFARAWYKLTGSLIGTPKLTSNMVELKNQIWNTIDVREGCRIHIRMGYGSNPSRLTTTFNGVIAEVEEYGDQLRFTAQSDGAELLSQVMSTSDTEKNGVFKFQCEASNIIASIMTERINKFTNSMYKGWGEPSKFGIESFGLPIGKIGITPTFAQDQLDITKNIYLGRYKPYLFTEHLSLFGKDGEDNFQFRLGGKYAWDVFQQCAQILPEFVCQPVYHQFESRIFYGLPFFPVRYRYDIGNSLKLETWTESCKTFAQLHMVTSSQDIILNKMKASKRNFSPNAIGLYTSGSGGKTKKTPVLYSDRTMDWSKQSTKVYDTTIVQNLLGLDDAYEFLGIRPGRTQATNVCKSNLIEQWKQTYKGEVVIIGDSTIKPLDYIYIEDTTKNIQGLSTVRSVIHSISGDAGFTTSYVPGLIAIDADSHSGAPNVYKGAIAALGLATSTVNAIKLGNQWSKASKALSAANVIRWMARESATPESIKMLKSATTYVWSSVKSGAYIAGEAKALNSAKQLFNTSTTGIKLKNGYNTVKNAKAVKTAFTTGKTALMAASNMAAPIIGPIIVGIVSQIAVNAVLDTIFDYLEYKNCVKVLPVYRNGYPFCISTTGAQHLILGASSNAITNDEVEYDVEDEEIEV